MCSLSVPERGAPTGLPCFAHPVSPKEHAAKVIALEGGRLVLPAALRSNQSGKAKAEVAGSVVRGVQEFFPHPSGDPIAPPGEGTLADRWGSRPQVAGGWAAPGRPPARRVPADPAPHLRGRLPRLMQRLRWRPRPAWVMWLQVTRCRAPPAGLTSGAAAPRRTLPGGPEAVQAPEKPWGAGLGDWFGGGGRLGGVPGRSQGCSPQGRGLGQGFQC